MTTARPAWREERRQDQRAVAQIARDDQAARVQAGIAAADARARLRRDERRDRQARRRVARTQRASWRAARVAWLRDHVTSLLFIPVIVVPGLLAWTAMAAYGQQVFGPPGVSLPAFSEGAMWAFAAATTITRRRQPGSPAWHLLLGTAVFAGFGAVLNFAHGLASGSVIKGVVMALISVAGVIAHQLITAGPRRSRADRAAAGTRRVIARRERAVRRAALRHADAILDADGNARLILRPGLVRLTRRRGRIRLEGAPHSPVGLPWPMVLPGSSEPAAGLLADLEAAEAVTAYRGWRSAHLTPVPALPPAPQPEPAAMRARNLSAPRSEAPQMSPAAASDGASNGSSSRASRPSARKPRKTAPRPSEKRAKAEQLLHGNPAISTADLVAQSGVSKATADRIRADRAKAAGR